MIAIEFHMVLKNPTNVREHWGTRAKRVKTQRLATRVWLLRELYPHYNWQHFDAGEAWTITLTRSAPRAMDDDGSIAALKHIRDEVAAYLGVDDGDPRIAWRYGQVKGPATVRIEFEVRPQSTVAEAKAAPGARIEAKRPLDPETMVSGNPGPLRPSSGRLLKSAVVRRAK